MQVSRTQDEEMLAKQAYLRALLGQWVLVPQELKEEEAADAEEGGGAVTLSLRQRGQLLQRMMWSKAAASKVRMCLMSLNRH